MRTEVVQRWHKRKARYRPTGEVINPRHYEVAEIFDELIVKDFIAENHYLGSLPPVRRRFGLYRADRLVGVAVFTVPCSFRAITNLFGPVDLNAYMDLGRFCLLHEVPANAESWMLAQALRCLRREGFEAIMSFSDPYPRRSTHGSVVFAGHVGTCYQALNAAFCGVATARTLHLFPDGTSLNDRSVSKIRKGEKGWRYGAKLLEDRGAGPVPNDPVARRAWLTFWTARLTEPYRHRGNLRYVFPLQPRVRKHMPAGLPYPRFTFCGVTVPERKVVNAGGRLASPNILV